MTPEQKIAAAVLKPSVEWVRGQIRRDRENRYSLLRDWTLPATVCSFWPDALSGWQSPLIRISRLTPGVVSITVRAYASTDEENICDGATLSPDTIPGILPAALFHDPWYCETDGKGSPRTYELLADEIGVPRKTLRKFGDRIFYSIATAGGCPRVVAWMYYAGIRVGYPIVKPFIAAFLAALLAVGCSGCIGTDGRFLDPGDYQPPAWEQVQ
jgi:hypothetical protein